MSTNSPSSSSSLSSPSSQMGDSIPNGVSFDDLATASALPPGMVSSSSSPDIDQQQNDDSQTTKQENHLDSASSQHSTHELDDPAPSPSLSLVSSNLPLDSITAVLTFGADKMQKTASSQAAAATRPTPPTTARRRALNRISRLLKSTDAHRQDSSQAYSVNRIKSSASSFHTRSLKEMDRKNILMHFKDSILEHEFVQFYYTLEPSVSHWRHFQRVKVAIAFGILFWGFFLIVDFFAATDKIDRYIVGILLRVIVLIIMIFYLLFTFIPHWVSRHYIITETIGTGVLILIVISTCIKAASYTYDSPSFPIGTMLTCLACYLLPRPRFHLSFLIAVSGTLAYTVSHLAFNFDDLQNSTIVSQKRIIIYIFAVTLTQFLGVTQVGIIELYFRKLFLYQQQLKDRRRLMLVESKRQDNLLLNILPREYVSHVKDLRMRFVREYQEVTVIQSDIVGFTQWCSSSPALLVVEVLNAHFTYFDHLAIKYQIEKKKTCGDAFIAFGNYRQSRGGKEDTPFDNFYSRAVALGITMNAAVMQINEEKNIDIHIRVGVGVGKCFLGVIGQNRITFDGFGPAFDEGEAMEATGVQDRVHVTQHIYEQTKHLYEYSEHDVHETYGQTYLVETPIPVTSEEEKQLADAIARGEVDTARDVDLLPANLETHSTLDRTYSVVDMKRWSEEMPDIHDLGAFVFVEQLPDDGGSGGGGGDWSRVGKKMSTKKGRQRRKQNRGDRSAGVITPHVVGSIDVVGGVDVVGGIEQLNDEPAFTKRPSTEPVSSPSRAPSASHGPSSTNAPSASHAHSTSPPHAHSASPPHSTSPQPPHPHSTSPTPPHPLLQSHSDSYLPQSNNPLKSTTFSIDQNGVLSMHNYQKFNLSHNKVFLFFYSFMTQLNFELQSFSDAIHNFRIMLVALVIMFAFVMMCILVLHPALSTSAPLILQYIALSAQFFISLFFLICSFIFSITQKKRGVNSDAAHPTTTTATELNNSVSSPKFSTLSIGEDSKDAAAKWSKNSLVREKSFVATQSQHSLSAVSIQSQLLPITSQSTTSHAPTLVLFLIGIITLTLSFFSTLVFCGFVLLERELLEFVGLMALLAFVVFNMFPTTPFLIRTGFSIVFQFILFLLALSIHQPVSSWSEMQEFGLQFLLSTAMLVFQIIMAFIMENSVIRSYIVRKQVEHEMFRLTLEQRRNKNLLLSVMPENILNRILKGGENVGMIADRINNGTVLFMGLVGFHEECSMYKNPQQALRTLHELYNIFDELLESFPACHKIKSIGTQYICISGIDEGHTKSTEEVSFYCQQLTMFALQARNLALEYIEQHGHQLKAQWTIRLGLHTGDYMAGLLGFSKYLFDVFSSSVNQAARLMQQGNKGVGEDGQLIISEGLTHDCLSQSEDYEFDIEDCGEKTIKGRGEVRVYRVLEYHGRVRQFASTLASGGGSRSSSMRSMTWQENVGGGGGNGHLQGSENGGQQQKVLRVG